MGGAVGLKGTDGAEVLAEARRRGAVPKAGERAAEALKAIARLGLDVGVVTCAGAMGEDSLNGLDIDSEVVYVKKGQSTAEDTRMAAEAMAKRGVELVLFCGGDGTARDVVSVLGTSIPVVGVPAGVKMHSSVFALSAADAAALIDDYLRTGQSREAEVMDVDEREFRRGIVSARLFGLARVPDDSAHLQPSKSSHHAGGATAEAEELATYVADEMEDGVLYILGPGSTTAAIAKAVGEEKTLLGVDAFEDRRRVGTDLSESDILALLEPNPKAKIVVTPIGSQGFVFGRGNQQISAEVIRKTGVGNIVVVATPTKLKETPTLRVDTGDAQLDSILRCPVKVVTGYKRRKLMSVT
ncbi:TPA: ATP-NAD kinase family protein [Thermoplasmata archaeon]|nr:ATP-NAD kinase family protein [Thermoplasmata archaeon]